MSVVGARATSASVNYVTNRGFVLRRGGPARPRGTPPVVAEVLAVNRALMHTLVGVLGAGLLFGKLVIEGLLLFASYAVQQRFVLARRMAVTRKGPGAGIPGRGKARGSTVENTPPRPKPWRRVLHPRRSDQGRARQAGGSTSVCAGRLATPTGQVSPLGPWLQYPPGFLCRYCWW